MKRRHSISFPRECWVAAIHTVLLALLLDVLPLHAAEVPYDIVLRNARIVDGTGSPWYRADLAIRGDTIARIAPAIRPRRHG